MSTETSDSGQEIEGTIAGQHIRAKGYRLLDLIWLPMMLGVAYSTLTIYNHEAAAQSERQQISISLKESNKEIAGALKESNAAIVEALRALTAEQKKSTNAAKEVACLSDPVMKNRQDAREFCKRIVRDDR